MQISILRTSAFLFAVFTVTPAPASVLFFDDFNAGASAAWGNERGNWRATGGQYDATNPSNSPTTYTDVTTLATLTDFVVDVDVNALNDGGIWLRSSFNGGNINGVLLVTGGFTGTNNGLYWHTVVSGGFSGVLNNGTQAGLQGTNHHLTVVVSGDTYAAYLDGSATPITSLTTSLFSSGSAGLYDFSPTSGASDPRGETFDNFQISAALSAVPEPASLGIIGLGLASLGFLRRKRAV